MGFRKPCSPALLLLPVSHKQILALTRSPFFGGSKPTASFLTEKTIFEFWPRLQGYLAQVKVYVKQVFGQVDSIMFEAAMTLNAIETQAKQKEYIR